MQGLAGAQLCACRHAAMHKCRPQHALSNPKFLPFFCLCRCLTGHGCQQVQERMLGGVRHNRFAQIMPRTCNRLLCRCCWLRGDRPGPPRQAVRGGGLGTPSPSSRRMAKKQQSADALSMKVWLLRPVAALEIYRILRSVQLPTLSLCPAAPPLACRGLLSCRCHLQLKRSSLSGTCHHRQSTWLGAWPAGAHSVRVWGYASYVPLRMKSSVL